MAYQLVHLDSQLSVYSAGREPTFDAEDVFQSLSLLLFIRSLARRSLDFHHLGALPRLDVDWRSFVLERMAEAPSENCKRYYYLFPGHAELGDFPSGLH